VLYNWRPTGQHCCTPGKPPSIPGSLQIAAAQIVSKKLDITMGAMKQVRENELEGMDQKRNALGPFSSGDYRVRSLTCSQSGETVMGELDMQTVYGSHGDHLEHVVVELEITGSGPDAGAVVAIQLIPPTHC
jgi:hypothetical protein